jgi:hypothetical protein
VRLARVVEDSLGRGRFPGIDVGHDADIPIVLERCRSWHASLCVSGTASAGPASDSKKCQSPAKTRVDQSFLEAGTGIHPPSPGALVTAARVGTHGAPRNFSAFNCPASLFGMSPAGRLTHGLVAPPRRSRTHRGRRAARRHFSRDRNGWSREPCNLDGTEPKVNAAVAAPEQGQGRIPCR